MPVGRARSASAAARSASIASVGRPAARCTSAATSRSITVSAGPTGPAAPPDARRLEELADLIGALGIPRSRGADADRDQLVEVGEVVSVAQEIPPARLERVPRAHRRGVVLEKIGSGAGGGRPHGVGHLTRAVELPELQPLVLKPGERMVVGSRFIQTAPRGPDFGRARRRLVRCGRLPPEPELDEDVRRHVARVARRGRDPGVDARNVQRPRRVIGVVIVMEQIVGGARMLGVAAEDLPQDLSRAPLRVAPGQLRVPVSLGRRAAQPVGRSDRGVEQRERVEARDLVVV